MTRRSGWSRLPRERNCLGCRGSAHRRRRPVSRELRWSSAGAWPPLPPSERVGVLLREGRPGRSWRRNRRFRYRNAVLPKQPCRSLKPHPAHTKGCATGSCTAGGLGRTKRSVQLPVCQKPTVRAGSRDLATTRLPCRTWRSPCLKDFDTSQCPPRRQRKTSAGEAAEEASHKEAACLAFALLARIRFCKRVLLSELFEQCRLLSQRHA